jgi:sugar lactone lactonase YvrE
VTDYGATPASADRYVLAESPVWFADRSQLLWIDVEEGSVFVGRLHDAVVETTRHYGFDHKVGAVVPGDDGSLLVAGQDRLVVVAPDGARRDGPSILSGDASRSNDGACDPSGRFLVGTYHFDERENEDTLQRLERDGTLTLIDADLSISNGLAWSPDGTLMYSTDTAKGIIWVRDYDTATGRVGTRCAHLTIEGGHPDGIAMDVQGSLWIAMWGDGEIRSFSPAGEPRDVVSIPAPHVSSVAFVGDDLDLLLVTTAYRDLDAQGRTLYPDAGRLFVADVGVTGHPTTLWDSSALK